MDVVHWRVNGIHGIYGFLLLMASIEAAWDLKTIWVSSGRERVRMIVDLGMLVGPLMKYGIHSLDLETRGAVNSSPDAHDILIIANAQHGPAKIIARLSKLVSDNGQKEILPVAGGNALLQAQDPLAAILVFLVLPDRLDARLEKVIVRDVRQRVWPFEVSKHGPELLGRGKGRHFLRRLFVVLEFGAGGPVPDHPRVLERVRGFLLNRR